MYKMVVEITKKIMGKTWYYNREALQWKKKIIELWKKMSDAERQIGQSNIADAALKKTRKYCGKKNKKHYRKRKRKI